MSSTEKKSFSQFIRQLFGGGDDPVDQSRGELFQDVQVAFWKPNVYRAENGQLENLSAEGAQIASYWQLSRGNQIELNFTFPLEFPTQVHSLRIQAVVTHCRKPHGRKRFRIWCQFNSLEEASAARIQEFLVWVEKNTD